MFASRLLRVLQTIPADVNYETCDLDAPDLKLIMKENQMEVLFHSNGYEMGVDPLSFSSADLGRKGGSETNMNTLACGLGDVDDLWNIGFSAHSESIDNYTRSVSDETGDISHGQERALLNLNDEDVVESLPSPTKDHDEIQSSSELVPPVVIDELIRGNEPKSEDSEAPSSCIPEKILGPDLHSCMDKNVVECELPEVYGSSNFHMVKDICVDVGVAPQERTSRESNQEDHAARFTSQLSKEDMVSGSITGDHDINVTPPDGFHDSAPEDTGQNAANRSKVVLESFQLVGSASSSEHNVNGNALNPFYSENMAHMDKELESFLDRIADNVSKGESSPSSARISQELMMEDSLLDSPKHEEDKVAQLPDEIPSLETILESLAVVFTSKDSKKDDMVTKLSYSSKVEKGTITFDFNSSNPDLSSSTDGKIELIDEKSKESQDEKAIDQSTPIAVESANKVEKVDGTVHDQTPSRQDATSKENGNPHSIMVPREVQNVDGESSFSMPDPVGLITYSGPIAYSGSTSLRSDSSTTSTRSFAFPILQSEWNSSPVRMHKADRRRIRRCRCLRQSFFCCRF